MLRLENSQEDTQQAARQAEMQFVGEELVIIVVITSHILHTVCLRTLHLSFHAHSTVSNLARYRGSRWWGWDLDPG